MKNGKTHFLVTLVFDENLDFTKQINTERSFKNEIINELARLFMDNEIKHFIVTDDEAINERLKEEQEPIFDEIRTEEVIDACRAAVNKYGADNQAKKAVEELAELQVELMHYLEGRGNLNNISEEMADVKIMLEQLLIIFGNDNFVAEWESIKAARLMERINADNKNCG